MSTQQNKRTHKRFDSNAPIHFSFFSSRLWHEYSTLTCNHIKNGMCFESSQRMAPGTSLFIRLDKDCNLDLASDRNICLRDTTLARVKWCRELNAYDGTRYSIGVRYY